MLHLDLDTAQTIVTAALQFARDRKMKPLAVAVVDARGALKAFAAEDNASLRRAEIAQGKAHAAIALGLSGSELEERAQQRPYFINAVGQALTMPFIPSRGATLIRSASGTTLGAIGISGDTSLNDELAAIAGVSAAGLTAEA